MCEGTFVSMWVYSRGVHAGVHAGALGFAVSSGLERHATFSDQVRVIFFSLFFWVVVVSVSTAGPQVRLQEPVSRARGSVRQPALQSG